MLWKLRYRKPFGAVDDFIEGKTLQEAEQIGRAFCEQSPGYKYIGVTPGVVATADILKNAKGEIVAPPKPARVGA